MNKTKTIGGKVFENREASNKFFNLFSSLTNDKGEDVGLEFAEKVRQAFAKKITSDKYLPTYYLTKKEVEVIGATF